MPVRYTRLSNDNVDYVFLQYFWFIEMPMISLFVALLPDKPTNLMVTNIKSRSAEISWLDPENTGDGNLTGFWIKLKKENSLLLNTTTNKLNKYERDNLTPYTTYEITVAAGNKHGFGEETITSFITPEEGKNEKCVDHVLDSAIGCWKVKCI